MGTDRSIQIIASSRSLILPVRRGHLLTRRPILEEGFIIFSLPRRTKLIFARVVVIISVISDLLHFFTSVAFGLYGEELYQN